MKATLLALIVVALGCASSGPDTAARLEVVPEADRPLGAALLDADRVVAGRLMTVARAPEYEPIGVFNFAGPGAQRGGAAFAYDATLRVDSTLFGGQSPTVAFTFFAPKDAPIPHPDSSAIWVLHRRTLWLLRRCSEIQSLTSAACPYDVGLALDSDADVRPLAEWPRLEALARTLGLGSAHPSR